MKCQFRATLIGDYLCSVCGARVDTLVERECDKEQLVNGYCDHLGKPSGLIECDSCKGRVQLKLFQCLYYQENCTLEKVSGLLLCCKRCGANTTLTEKGK